MMGIFPDWQLSAVPQRRSMTGCIPTTGYEMILRAAGAPEIDFDRFQDEFDLDEDLPLGAAPVNHFGGVAAAIGKKYPSVVFTYREFAKGEGATKLAFIEEQLAAQRPVLISFANAAFDERGWHIAPVVDADDNSLTLLWSIARYVQAALMKLPKAALVQIHDNVQGGNEVAFLEYL